MRIVYEWLYLLGVRLYSGLIRVAAPFHPKAKLMVEGRKGILTTLRSKLKRGDRYIWIHAASMGEFEQARPIIEAIKKDYPEYKICITFFSPSGYEPRKDYPLADIVTYLPWDGSKNVAAFLDLLKPELIIFIKYEFWLHMLGQIRKRGIRTYLVSAIFRPEQPFFKSGYGVIFREALQTFQHIFVQNKESAELLSQIATNYYTIAGDTRIDRVISIQKQAEGIEDIQNLSNQLHQEGRVIAAFGSSWEKDEEVYLPLLAQFPHIFPIIVPHEITEPHLHYIQEHAPYPVQRYSEWNGEREGVQLLVLDKMGMLSRLYRYVDFAYIGGGFGKGIHNTAEAAVYGIPLIFGPKYHKFEEAKRLLNASAAYSINGAEDLAKVLKQWEKAPEEMKTSGQHAHDVIWSMEGATEKILWHIFQ